MLTTQPLVNKKKKELLIKRNSSANHSINARFKQGFVASSVLAR